MSETSTCGSRRRAAAIDSSSCLLTGFLPGDCTMTTVTFFAAMCRLKSGSLVHLSFDHLLRLLPPAREQLDVLAGREQFSSSLKFVKPARVVIVGVDHRRIAKQ